jgi:exonuclease III
MTCSNFLSSINVRGLNTSVKRSAVRDMVAIVKGTVVCLQETKL